MRLSLQLEFAIYRHGLSSETALFPRISRVNLQTDFCSIIFWKIFRGDLIIDPVCKAGKYFSCLVRYYALAKIRENRRADVAERLWICRLARAVKASLRKALFELIVLYKNHFRRMNRL